MVIPPEYGLNLNVETLSLTPGDTFKIYAHLGGEVLSKSKMDLSLGNVEYGSPWPDKLGHQIRMVRQTILTCT
jgi:hypothetical protein